MTTINLPKKLIAAFASTAALMGTAPVFAAGQSAPVPQTQLRPDPVKQARALFADAQKPDNKGFAAFEDLRKTINLLNDIMREKHLNKDQASALVGTDTKTFFALFRENAKWAAAQFTYHYNIKENWDEKDADRLIEYPLDILDMARMDPKKPESWEGTGITYEDYVEIRKGFFIHRAETAYKVVLRAEAEGKDAMLAISFVGQYLHKAGFQGAERGGEFVENEEGYKAIGTTSADFHALEKRQEILCARRVWKTMIDEKQTGDNALISLSIVETSLQSAGFQTDKVQGFEAMGISIDEFRSARRQHALEKVVALWQNECARGQDLSQYCLREIRQTVEQYFDPGQREDVYARINTTGQAVEGKLQELRRDEDRHLNQVPAPRP
jgi:hypothetical protein